MISSYERVILDKLLDKYEKSKSFSGNNKVRQKFSVRISAMIPRYGDHANYEIFSTVNEAVDILCRKELIRGKSSSANVFNELVLDLDHLDQAYAYADRQPKKESHQAVLQLLEKFQEKNDILKRFCQAQVERITANRSIQFFHEDLPELANILTAVDQLLKIETEMYIRDFSVKVFNDSKLFDGISGKVVSLLYEYGDFAEKDRLLGDLNLIKNPAYVNFKGAGVITIKGQKIDFSALNGDLAISSSLLEEIERIEVTGIGVITIENLTSFHSFQQKDMFVIYLGGYHNQVRRDFIKKIHQQNHDIGFYHFGDIDAGGFYILEHLQRQTGIDFEPYKMDLATLQEYAGYAKKLTDNDRERLSKLQAGRFGDVISFMLENNCKLEQEAVTVN